MATKTKTRPEASRKPVEEPRAVATRKTGSVPAALADRMREDSGKGTSSDQSDSLIPLLYVLQPLSPQVLAKNPAKIPGAEAGDLWLRGSVDSIVKGEEGLVFQPCHFSKDWVEWISRKKGGGFVGRHKERPDDAVQKKDPEKPSRMSWKLGDHDLVETRYMAGIVHRGSERLPYIIPFSSTGHSVAKGWMFMMRSKNVGGRVAPSFGTLYRLKTTMRSNNDGEWFVISVDQEGDGWIVDEGDYEMGRSLHDAFESGAKRAETPEDIGDRGDVDEDRDV